MTSFFAVLSSLQSEDEEVESALVPFLQAYVSKLRNSQKRGSPTSQVLSHLLRVELYPPVSHSSPASGVLQQSLGLYMSNTCELGMLAVI